VHLGVSRSREKLVHSFEQNCSKLTYAFQNLKRRSRPIQSGDFAAHIRSLIFPSEGKIFVAVFAVFGRSKNGVSSFS